MQATQNKEGYQKAELIQRLDRLGKEGKLHSRAIDAICKGIVPVLPLPSLMQVSKMSKGKLIKTLKYCPESDFFLNQRKVLQASELSLVSARNYVCKMVAQSIEKVQIEAVGEVNSSEEASLSVDIQLNPRLLIEDEADLQLDLEALEEVSDSDQEEDDWEQESKEEAEPAKIKLMTNNEALDEAEEQKAANADDSLQ